MFKISFLKIFLSKTKFMLYLYSEKKITENNISAMWSKHLKLRVKSQTTYIMDQSKYILFLTT